MKSHARVVVIGGGVVGCAVLYNLARLGWKDDVVLLEANQLSAGSSHLAAGQIHTINANSNLSSLQGYSLAFYPELEEVSGQDCGLHRTGVIYLASTPERLDYLKKERSKARHLGFDSEFISMSDVKRLNPLLNTELYLGALFDPLDGHVDPYSVVQAFGKAARILGADIYQHAPVTEIRSRSTGEWDVVTPKGTVRAEIVVNAAGLWARDVGAMVGIQLPIQAMQHHYLITGPIDELLELDHEVPGTIDYEGNAYTRQEGQGLLIGTYEENGVPWALDATPEGDALDNLQPDLDRIAPRLEEAYKRIPALGPAGVKNVMNGPFCFAPDTNPLVGPVPGLRNFFVAAGIMAGFCQSAGIGLRLAEWIIEGEPGIDVFAMDIARYGSFATREYTVEKVREAFGRRFKITYPNEELPAARPWKTTPLYERLKLDGAVFGSAFGLEHALWFAPKGEAQVERPTFRRSNAFEYVAEECRAVRNQVGVFELANYAKYEVTGTGAAGWLDRVFASRLPATGKLRLAPMLSPNGRLLGDLTIGKLSDNRFFIFGSAIAQEAHMRWFRKNLTEAGVEIRNRTSELLGLTIAGPKSRDILFQLTRTDVSDDAFPFLAMREMEVGGVPSLVARVSFTGELGYEIYCEHQYQIALDNVLMRAGSELGLRRFGARALMSLRLEKNYGAWTLDYRTDFTPAESGLDRFIDYGKSTDFIGRAAVLNEREKGPKRRLVSLTVDAGDSDVTGDEAILHNGECVGLVTSGGYAHSTGVSMALGYVPSNLATDGNSFEVDILGELRPARVQLDPIYDPKGERMRS